MNLSFLFIFIIITTIIIDFLTYKKDEEIVLKDYKIKRVIKNFISNSITYLTFTLVFSLIFKYSLVPDEYIYCNNICSLTITNSLVGIIVISLQILNIYNFYDNYIYTFRYFARYNKIYEKVFTFLMGVAVIILNEFILSNIDLSFVTFEESTFNILLRIVLFSAYIFMTLLIIIRETWNFINTRKKEVYD